MRAWFINGLLFALAVGGVPPTGLAQEALAQPDVGPNTEHRFPPLKIPDGFTATLFACDPLMEYPSVIALGPRAGTLFVAHDYMTGLGVDIVRRDEVRLIEDSDGDGYADKSTMFAGGFNSIQGLEFYDGAVFVMHAPLLTSLRDTDGDGVADERSDLIKGLGLPPEENSNRLHCANGVVAGHDGWLYLALGDQGCDVQRPEGDRLLFQQGGILRCRRDGSDLHVFATGLRNIYDVALDAELNVFVRDNENDGGDYMIRVCHCFFGSDHGYPYHYYERPDEAMQPLADLGRGSSAGGASYLETAFPKEYRESLFFCEWGRAVVRYPLTRRSSSFEPMAEIDFAAGADDDPYGFKPTDLIVDRDGSLLISDWCDGQRPKRGRGRIYRISASVDNESRLTNDEPRVDELDLPALIARLDSESYHGRVAAQLALQRRDAEAVGAVLTATKSNKLNTLGRLHAVWIVALSGVDSAVDELFEIAESDPAASVRAQAVRAIGDLTDPVLVHHRIDAGRGNNRIAIRLAQTSQKADPRVALEALIVFRRLHWCQTPAWISEHLTVEDPALNHAAQQSLRESRYWPAVMPLLDHSPRLRKLALHATAEQRVSYLATQFIERLANSDNPEHRREYADALSRIVRKEPPWTYWGFRPAPRPAASVDWAKTPAIVAALNEALADEDHDVRAFALQRMQREGVESELSRLTAWLREETDEGRVAGILGALKPANALTTGPILREVVLRRNLPAANRLAALSAFVAGLPSDDAGSLVTFGTQLEEGPVLAAVLDELGNQTKLDANDLLLAKLGSSSAEVRAAAIQSLGLRKSSAARERIVSLLDDASIDVQRAAAEAAGLLDAAEAADKLLTFSKHDDKELVRTSLVSLRQLKDDRAVDHAAAVLEDRGAQVAALQYLREFGSPELADRIVQAAATNPALAFQRETVLTLSTWMERFPDEKPGLIDDVAKIHGQSGQPMFWGISGPLTEAEVDSFAQWLSNPLPANRFSISGGFPLTDDKKTSQRIGEAADASVQLDNPTGGESTWIAWSFIQVPVETNIEVLASASGSMAVWLQNSRVHARENPGAFRLDSDRFPATPQAGWSTIFVKVTSSDKAPRFHLRFRRRSSKAEHERLTQFALQSSGNPARGREAF
ncbi:MAG: HEAT repeat domain-containing protein [Planctomycetota bacterium]|nr:HEAT repeat domain-containing protein [Planctomycetota bacterium]